MTSPIWRYIGSDGRALVIRTEPAIDGARSKEGLQPGEFFYVSEEQEGDSDVTYLKLQDGRGWVFDSKPGVGVLCENVKAKLWHYEGVGDGQPLVIRSEPALDGLRTGKGLSPGELFYVSEERVGADEILFLRIADGRGWAFDRKPGLGVMCRRHEAVLRLSSIEGSRSTLWRYAAADGKPINMRVEPSLEAARNGHALKPGEFFRVDEELSSSDGILFLRLADGRGWLFDKKPGIGVMCARHEAPVTLHIYDVPRHKAGVRLNGLFRAIGTGAFHAGVEVFGKEWSYGCQQRDDSGSGVFTCDPRGCEAHRYREEVPMGHTSLTEEQVRQILEELRLTWKSQDYNILRQNCCHFSDELCERLGVGRTPAWVMNMANLGAALQDKQISFAETTSELIERGRDAGGRMKEVCAAGGGYAQEMVEAYAQQVRNGERSVPNVPSFREMRRAFKEQFDCIS
eukprot:TRINITY_DN37249_c0_g1_i1.p1 TRINITY_DN37249_c0_g1~~TRINITY_DN37249_c0_g1_i1.p1  ORF type:complete len:457 (-),score=103.72 TRINITY_DN37249_c0_g1_i1:47-1417(-)